MGLVNIAEENKQTPSISHNQYQQLKALFYAATTTSSVASGATFSGNIISLSVFLSIYQILDTRATHHMTYSKSLFTSFKTQSDTSPVILLNGQLVAIYFTRSVDFPNGLYLNNVLYVPSFKLNLLSNPKLTKEMSCHVIFHHDHYLIQDLQLRKTIGLGKLRGGLYILDSVRVNAVVTKPIFDHWHTCFGHPSPRRLKLLSKSILGITFMEDGVCNVGLLAKETRTFS